MPVTKLILSIVYMKNQMTYNDQHTIEENKVVLLIIIDFVCMNPYNTESMVLVKEKTGKPRELKKRGKPRELILVKRAKAIR